MKWAICVALVGALLLGGAARAQSSAGDRVDPAIWQGEAASGPAVHRATSVTLPAEIEGFRRTRLAALNADDVAANYERREGQSETRVTVYLFRPGALPEHSLRGSLTAFATVSPEAFVWSQGPFDLASPRALHGYKGTFKTGIGPGTVMDYLYFVRLGAWTVKVRATLGGVQNIAEEGRIDAFVRALPWTEILAANGDCTGAACTTPPFEPMDNHVAQMTLGRLLFSRQIDGRQEADLPVAASATIPLAGTVDIRRGSGDPLLYVASIPNLATYRLMRFPDPVNRMFTETFGMVSVSKPVYGLVIQIGGETLLPRLFHGEPTPEAFGEAVGGLVLSEMPGPMVSVARAAQDMPE